VQLDPFLDIEAVHALTTYSVSRIRELYKRKHDPLPAIRTGRRGEKVLFSRPAVEKWLLRRGRRGRSTSQNESGPGEVQLPEASPTTAPGI
jgi:hypothetical protein